MDAIVAVYADWGIGAKGTQPLVIPADRRRFRELTMGAAVIVGRRTLEDFPGGKPLPGRENFVLSRRNITIEGAQVVHDPDEAVAAAAQHARCFVIGGDSVFRQMFPHMTRVYVTKIDAAPHSDVFFPDLDADPAWRCVSAEPRAEHARKAADGRQRIRAVMPCFGLERHGADALGGCDRVPVQRLLDDDGHHRRDEREHAGGGERFAVEDLRDACVADGSADEHENIAEQDRGDALELFVPVGMAGVGRLVGKDCADHHDQRAEDVRRRVHGVGHYGRRVRHDAGDELEHRQRGVADDADGGYLHGHALGIIGCGSGFTHEKRLLSE